MGKISEKYQVWGVYAFLLLSTLAVYAQVRNHELVNYDDLAYVGENEQVLNGLTREGFVWAFTTGYENNWHPLTWLSHMLDCELFGLSATAHHQINLLFHLANTLLLFVVFKRMTGSLWRSGFVAAAFALHPLHTESVAWVAERKDVLSTFFWMLTMIAYVYYARRPRVARYVLVLLFFALGLMAKPMLVTLPFVLLLSDYWPLKRFGTCRGEARNKQAEDVQRAVYQRSTFSGLLWEKLPLFALTVFSCVVTYIAQQSGGAVNPIRPGLRIANAVVSYCDYIGKMLWPRGLAVLYPHPHQVQIGLLAGCAILLVGVTIAAILQRRHRPWLTVGWLWYLGTLVPVIGLVQVGAQARADRYTYVPLVGLFVVVAWGLGELVGGRRYRKIMVGIATGAAFCGLTVCTWLQVGYWRDSITLLEHAVQVTPNNTIAHTNLGVAWKARGEINKAIKHYRKALELGGGGFRAYNNLAAALRKQGKIDEAIEQYQKALQLKPDSWQVHYNLALALTDKGRLDSAIEHCRKALKLSGGFAQCHYLLGQALRKKGKIDEAIKHYEALLRVKPGHAGAIKGLEAARARQGGKK